MAAAQRWLESATDYAAPEVAKEAAEHMLRLKPTEAHADTWRRLMIAADKNKAILKEMKLTVHKPKKRQPRKFEHLLKK